MRIFHATAVLVPALALLGGCGARSMLEPQPGTALPVAPYGSDARRSADELLTLDTLAAPERSVELRRKSEERADDPFDLPPE